MVRDGREVLALVQAVCIYKSDDLTVNSRVLKNMLTLESLSPGQAHESCDREGGDKRSQDRSGPPKPEVKAASSGSRQTRAA